MYFRDAPHLSSCLLGSLMERENRKKGDRRLLLSVTVVAYIDCLVNGTASLFYSHNYTMLRRTNTTTSRQMNRPTFIRFVQVANKRSLILRTHTLSCSLSLALSLCVLSPFSVSSISFSRFPFCPPSDLPKGLWNCGQYSPFGFSMLMIPTINDPSVYIVTSIGISQNANGFPPKRCTEQQERQHTHPTRHCENTNMDTHTIELNWAQQQQERRLVCLSRTTIVHVCLDRKKTKDSTLWPPVLVVLILARRGHTHGWLAPTKWHLCGLQTLGLGQYRWTMRWKYTTIDKKTSPRSEHCTGNHSSNLWNDLDCLCLSISPNPVIVYVSLSCLYRNELLGIIGGHPNEVMMDMFLHCLGWLYFTYASARNEKHTHTRLFRWIGSFLFLPRREEKPTSIHRPPCVLECSVLEWTVLCNDGVLLLLLLLLLLLPSFRFVPPTDTLERSWISWHCVWKYALPLSLSIRHYIFFSFSDKSTVVSFGCPTPSLQDWLAVFFWSLAIGYRRIGRPSASPWRSDMLSIEPYCPFRATQPVVPWIGTKPT